MTRALLLAVLSASVLWAPGVSHAQRSVRGPAEVASDRPAAALPSAPSAPASPSEHALRPAAAPTVMKRVRVIDVSGELAYLDLGARDGLRSGQAVTFGAQRYVITAVNDEHAVLALEGHRLGIGAEGTATVPRAAPPGIAQLRPEHTSAAYRGQWMKPVLPARQQRVAPVPLGTLAPVAARPARTEIDLSTRTSTIVPLSRNDDVVGISELRGRLRAKPFDDVPFALLADASWLAYWARSEALADRPSARVRELELRYGTERGAQLRAGRMLSPAPMLGELDGGRARTAYFGPLAAGAFGGFLPDPVDGRLDDASQRFGVDLTLDAPDVGTRPYAALVAHGTTFDGELDERKLDLLLGLHPGDVQLHAAGELSLYDRGSELADDAVELTLAHLDATYEGARVIAGVRGSTYLPERSERLRALLDVSRVCTTEPGSFACAGVLPRRYAAGGQLALALGSALWLDTDATFATASDQALDHVSGRLGVRWIDPIAPRGALLASSLAVTGSGTHDVFYDRLGLRLSLDASFSPAFDLSLAYEPGMASFASAPGTLLLHEAQLDFGWVITRALQWVWSTQAELGDEINVLYLSTLVRVRP